MKKLHVYACGGDGTFNEVSAARQGLDNVAVCPFPTGTARLLPDVRRGKDMFRDLDALTARQ